MTPGEGPAVTAAAELTATFKAMTAQMARLSRRGKRDRRLILGLVVSITLDLALTAGLAWNTVRQNDVQASSHASDIRQCQLANAARAQDIAIWNRALQVPPGATAAQKALVADLERLVRVKDAPRDCTAAYAK
jgi:hypothetical protein